MAANKATLETLLAAAVEIGDVDQRDAYLQQACAGEAEQLAELQSMVRDYFAAGNLFDRPAALMPTVALSFPQMLGSRIGPYKLLEQIGEGGMGVVYMAEQKEPMRRLVALKVIKPGMDTREVIARFEAERQALAVMNHPNIAKVLDAGATELGSPYFVMELVKGIPITEFCDAQKLNTRERLQLFATACLAVQHAHHKGLIHRDLKPSNLLVEIHDVTPCPKVIDFGVAKAMGWQLTEKTLHTGLHQIVGTPLYMSPEQAGQSSIDVDTRSDVYSLGVLLYELLTGTTPFDKETLTKAGYDEMRRIIREDDPPRPSVRVSTLHAQALSTVSACRTIEPRKLCQQLRGELDWIVMKALEKDRARRYESASALAADVQRYLNDQPVQACPPRTSYKLRKLVRRHKGPVWAAALIVLALIVGVVGLGWGMAESERGRRLAELREKEARAAALAEAQLRQDAVESQRQAESANRQAQQSAQTTHESEADTKAFSRFMVNDILAAARPIGERGGLGIDVTVRQALEAADEQVAVTFQDRPRAEAIARHNLGVTYRLIGELPRAESHLRRALALRMQSLGHDHEDTLDSQNSLAVLLGRLGKHEEALSLLKEIVRLQKAKPGADHNPLTFVYVRNLASEYGTSGQINLAIPLWEEALTQQRRLLLSNDPALLNTMNNLGWGYMMLDKLDRAFPLWEEAVKFQIAAPGRDHPDTLATLNNLASGYARGGKPEQALPLFQEILEWRRDKLGPDHPDTLDSMNHLASTFDALNLPTQALPLLEAAVQRRKVKLGADHVDTLVAMGNLATCLWKLKRHQEAANVLSDLLTLSQRVHGEDDIRTLMAQRDLALQAVALKRLDQAIPLYEELILRFMATIGPDKDETLRAMRSLAAAYRSAGKPELAVPLLIDWVTRTDERSDSSEDRATVYLTIALVLTDLERFDEAEGWFRKRVDAMKRKAGVSSKEYFLASANLADNLYKQQRHDEAEPLMRECQNYFERTNPKNYTTFNWKSRYGAMVLRQGRDLQSTDPAVACQKLKEAEAHLIAGYEGLKSREAEIPEQSRHRSLSSAIERLVELYETLDQPVEAAKWRGLASGGEEAAKGEPRPLPQGKGTTGK